MSVAKRLVIRGLGASGIVTRLRGHPDQMRAVVLAYHSVSEPDPANDRYRCPSIALPPAAFERHMRFLADHYDVVPMARIVACLEAGEPFPPRAVAITFDDGYRDNYTIAYPILRRLGLPATLYVTADAVGDGWRFWVARLRWLLLVCRATALTLPRLGHIDLGSPASRRRAIDRLTVTLKALSCCERDADLERLEAATGIHEPPREATTWMASWEELSEMAAGGIEIGAHSRTHPILTCQDTTVATEEIAGARRLLEKSLGRPVEHFAYPNGGGRPNHDARITALARAAGFRSAATSERGAVHLGDDPLRLRRLGVAERHRIDAFALELERDRLPGLGHRRTAERRTLVLVGPPATTRGGIATCMRTVRRSALADRFDIVAVSPTGRRPHYDLGPRGNLAALGGALSRFVTTLVTRRPAAVQVHVSHFGDFWRNAPFVLLGALVSVPCVIVVHGSRFDTFYHESTALVRAMIRLVLRRAAALCVRGEHWRHLLGGIVPGARVELLPTTTDLVEDAPGPRFDPVPTVLFVGGSPHLDDARRKGLPDLLAAMPAVTAAVPGVRFQIAGPAVGQIRQPLPDATAARVEFLGSLAPAALPAVYRRSTLVVLPSRAEGMPNVVLEAMAHALPVVSTTVGAIGEVLEDGRGGLLVPPAAPDRLATAIVTVLLDPARARAMGAHNHARIAAHFSNHETSRRLLSLYDSLLPPGSAEPSARAAS
jgi:glycosyltransferase involved in cell wall biosynthesis